MQVAGSHGSLLLRSFSSHQKTDELFRFLFLLPRRQTIETLKDAI